VIYILNKNFFFRQYNRDIKITNNTHSNYDFKILVLKNYNNKGGVLGETKCTQHHFMTLKDYLISDIFLIIELSPEVIE